MKESFHRSNASLSRKRVGYGGAYSGFWILDFGFFQRPTDDGVWCDSYHPMAVRMEQWRHAVLGRDEGQFRILLHIPQMPTCGVTENEPSALGAEVHAVERTQRSAAAADDPQHVAAHDAPDRKAARLT